MSNCATGGKKMARHFAGGGKIDPDELMRQMSAKYGAPAAGPVTQQPVAQVAPAPVQQSQPKPQQGPGSGIFGIFKGRTAQIDKASGYANGGKIEGPGTPTSDSIPAQVIETGEPIKVATKERIVSEAQDRLLETISRGIGFKSLDALLEAGTGKPVGPTIKAGKRAAEDGKKPEWRGLLEPSPTASFDPQTHKGVAPILSGLSTGAAVNRLGGENPVRAVASALPENSPIRKAVMDNTAPPPAAMPPAATVTTQSAAAQTLPQASYSNEGRSVPSPIVAPVKAVGAVPVLQNDSPPAGYRPEVNGVTWKAKGFDPTAQDMAQGTGAIAVTSGPNAGKNIAVGPQIYTAADGTPTNDWSKTAQFAQGTAQAQKDRDTLAMMQRNRLERDAFDPSITDPTVRDNARLQIADMDKSQQQKTENDFKRQQLFNPLDTQAKQLDIKAKQGSIDKFEIDKAILQGQAGDANAVRAARAELSAAVDSGDPAKIKAAKTKAEAVGIKFDKPSNEFTAVTNQMGGTTVLDKNTGAGSIFNVQGKKVADIPAPGAQASPQQEYQAAIARAAGNPDLIAKINERAKANGVIK